ncbi:MAG TPA: hypothetical protein VK007_00835 [Acidimicrobiales bacterium]|nr:hypothetical protein [Acidimicrobiales bacterium]
MTDAMDPQDRAEALDADKIGAEYPPVEPMGVDEAEVTPHGEATSESFEERDARYRAGGDDDRPLVQPYHEADEDLLDDEAQAVADAEEGDPRARQTTSEADGGGAAAVEADPVPPAAEEAALHVEDGPS